ncbi:PAS domain S-box-containing protein/diguanylate cyclase (GGDEF)-like protein [Alteromonadaceae bacterium 2753L.S.0a.02]|nr:PAS domain S-box-containing protein/diguanylate cyclase (GGDEF)-like protein [Alteromonadaceae bacterium 2753L.S.0a.02]
MATKNAMDAENSQRDHRNATENPKQEAERQPYSPLQLMLDCVSDAIILMQALVEDGELVDFIVLEANAAAIALIPGGSDALGKNASSLLHSFFGPMLGAAQEVLVRGEKQSLTLLQDRRFLQAELFNPQDKLLCAVISDDSNTKALHAAELESCIEQAPDAIFIANLDGRYTHVNSAGCKLLGYEREQILSMSIEDVIPKVDLARLQLDKLRLQDGETITAEWKIKRSNGKYLAVEVSGKILNDGRWLGFVRDISERKNAEKDLQLSAAVFNNTREAIVITNATREIVAANAAFTELCGYTEQDVKGKDIKHYVYRSGKHEAAFYENLWQRVDAEGFWRGEVWSRRSDGEVFPSWQNISVVCDDYGNISHYVLILSDISEKKAAEQKLSYLAHHDALTGLTNRIAFNGNLEHALNHARRNGSKVALLFIDLDHFKDVNDNYGHLAGDQLLQITADRLRRCVRGEDAVARMGGDEFTIILEHINCIDDAVGVAKKVVQSMALPVRLASGEVEVGLSIGISLFPDHATTVNDLTRTADAAMYGAKKCKERDYQVFID